MLARAGVVALNVRGLAPQTVKLHALGAHLGTLLLLPTQGTDSQLVETVDQFEGPAAAAVVGDIGDELPWLGGVKLVGQFGVAEFADAEVAVGVVEDAAVADRGADAADVADVVEVGDALKVVGVAHGAAFLAAGRDSALDAVEGLADPAEGPAEFNLSALLALGLGHFLVTPQVEL